jgi:hypothetical protein
MTIRLGDPPVPVPEPFAALLADLAAGCANMNTASNPACDWLFPGRAGQPITPGALQQQLRAHGVPVTRTRTAAFRQLVLQAPAPVIAQALGYYPGTAAAHLSAAGGTWARYPAARTLRDRARAHRRRRRETRQAAASSRRPLPRRESRLSEQQKAQITARAKASGTSVPRLLAEAATAGTAPTTTDHNANSAQLLTARRAVIAMNHQISALTSTHPERTCQAIAVQLAAAAAGIEDILSRLAYQHIHPAAQPLTGQTPDPG